MSSELACGGSLKPEPSLDSGRAWLVDEESRLPGALRAVEDTIAEIGMLVGDILQEGSAAVSVAANFEPQVGDFTGRSAHRVELAVICRETLADVAAALGHVIRAANRAGRS